MQSSVTEIFTEVKVESSLINIYTILIKKEILFFHTKDSLHVAKYYYTCQNLVLFIPTCVHTVYYK